MSKSTEEPDTLSTARADLTTVSNLLYAAFMAAERLHDENDRRGMMALLNVIDLKLEIVRIRLDECGKPVKGVKADPVIAAGRAVVDGGDQTKDTQSAG